MVIPEGGMEGSGGIDNNSYIETISSNVLLHPRLTVVNNVLSVDVSNLFLKFPK